VVDGFDAQVITAKLQPAHVAEDRIRPGEWHPFAVRNSAALFRSRRQADDPPLKLDFVDGRYR
jgi:hypothetical protein